MKHLRKYFPALLLVCLFLAPARLLLATEVYHPPCPYCGVPGCPGWCMYNGAAFVSQSVPSSMVAGSQASVTIVMKNNGTRTWTNASPYSYNLGNLGNTTWGVSRVSVGATPVAPNQNKTFTFTITAPATPGTYNFQWKMVQEYIEWFGGATPNVVITVTSPNPLVNDAAFVSQNVPSFMLPGAQATVTIVMNNNGTLPWTNTAPNPYNLACQNGTTWGTSQVSVGATAVQPTQNKTFTFTITAPTTPGTYNFQWKMEQAGKGAFGTLTTNKTITVKDLTSIDPLTGLPKGMLQDSNGNGIPDLVEYNLGLDPTQNNTGNPLLNNIKRDYNYDKNNQLITAPERTYQLDAEGNIKSQ